MRVFNDEEWERLHRENPQLKKSFKDYCPTCLKENGCTYVWGGQKVQCDCQQQLNLHKHYLWAGIGSTYQRLDWGDFEGDDKIVQALAVYVENRKRYLARGVGLFFTGDYGVGKTMLANLVLKEFVREGYRCYATTFSSVVEMFTAGWKSSSEQRYFQDRFIGSEVVLLDDVGRELRTRSKLSETTFDDILRQRVQAGRPTNITTNLTLNELEEGYGSAVLSLIREKSIVFDFGAGDYRSRANTRELDEIKAGLTRPIV